MILEVWKKWPETLHHGMIETCTFIDIHLLFKKIWIQAWHTLFESDYPGERRKVVGGDWHLGNLYRMHPQSQMMQLSVPSLVSWNIIESEDDFSGCWKNIIHQPQSSQHRFHKFIKIFFIFINNNYYCFCDDCRTDQQ